MIKNLEYTFLDITIIWRSPLRIKKPSRFSRNSGELSYLINDLLEDAIKISKIRGETLVCISLRESPTKLNSLS
jgi:hypothetical protein